MRTARFDLFHNRNFCLLWAGQGISYLGDQFDLIAMPWLVLRLTSDPFILGMVMALSGAPRALFMLIGGAFTDRFSSRTVMLISDIARMILTAFLGLLVFSNQIHIWMLYGFALVFGLISGFFTPASNAMVPSVVDPKSLQAGNAIMQGTTQLSLFLGPVVAGGVIALFTNKAVGATVPGLTGIGLAFLIDSLSFLVSAISLWMIRLDGASGREKGEDQGILHSIQTGIRFVMNDPILRLVFLLLAAANLLFVGPLLIGIPYLADTRLSGGAAAYGMILSAYGGGNLFGILLAGSLPKPNASRLTRLIIGLIVMFSFILASFGFLTSTRIAFLILLVLGTGNGYLAILLLTSIQENTPKELLGRVMSLLLFANIGLVPVSQALSGMLIKLNMNMLFLTVGFLTFLAAIYLALTPELGSVTARLVREEARDR